MDNDTFTVVDADTISFHNTVEVNYQISDDGMLSFEVVVPDPCVDTCAEEHAWAISAFYPGDFERSD